MTKPLATYLHDHLSGASYAADLLDGLRERYAGQPLGEFSTRLQKDIRADKEILHKIAQQFGSASSELKEGTAWLSEKLSRMKLSHGDPMGLGTFEALEFLALGIHGKLSLWRALSEISPQVPDLAQFNLATLIERAQQQEEAVEEFRLAAAKHALVAQLA